MLINSLISLKGGVIEESYAVFSQILFSIITFIIKVIIIILDLIVVLSPFLICYSLINVLFCILMRNNLFKMQRIDPNCIKTILTVKTMQNIVLIFCWILFYYIRFGHYDFSGEDLFMTLLFVYLIFIPIGIITSLFLNKTLRKSGIKKFFFTVWISTTVPLFDFIFLFLIYKRK